MHFGDVRVVKSSDANVLKYVFTRHDAVAEAVLYKYPTYEERTVICCSTHRRWLRTAMVCSIMDARTSKHGSTERRPRPYANPHASCRGGRVGTPWARFHAK